MMFIHMYLISYLVYFEGCRLTSLFCYLFIYIIIYRIWNYIHPYHQAPIFTPYEHLIAVKGKLQTHCITTYVRSGVHHKLYGLSKIPRNF